MAGKQYSRKRKLIFWTGAVMLLNTALFITLIEKSFGQAATDLKPLDKVQVRPALTNNCPMTITVRGVDNSSPNFQRIFLTLRNDTQLPIRAFVLQGVGERSREPGNILVFDFSGEPLAAGGQSSQEYPIERSLIQKDQSFLVSLDYVEFTNGNSWGDDENKKSEFIEASRIGRLAVIAQYRDSLRKDDHKWLDVSLADNFADLVPNVSDAGKSDEWNQGYRVGYRSILSYLRNIRIQHPETAILSKLVELENDNSRSARKKL